MRGSLRLLPLVLLLSPTPIFLSQPHQDDAMGRRFPASSDGSGGNEGNRHSPVSVQDVQELLAVSNTLLKRLSLVYASAILRRAAAGSLEPGVPPFNLCAILLASYETLAERLPEVDQNATAASIEYHSGNLRVTGTINFPKPGSPFFALSNINVSVGNNEVLSQVRMQLPIEGDQLFHLFMLTVQGAREVAAAMVLVITLIDKLFGNGESEDSSVQLQFAPEEK